MGQSGSDNFVAEDSPGIGNQGSSGTGDPLCHGNEGLLYLRIHL